MLGVSANKMTCASYALLLLGLLLPNFFVIPVELQIICTATPILIIGSYVSLRENVEQESMTFKDAVLFPVFGSIALLSVYLCYKFLPKVYINILLTTYLTIMGVFALSETILPHTERLLSHVMTLKKWEYDMNLPYFGKVNLSFNMGNIVSILISICVALVWICTRHWVPHNIFAIAFSIQAVSLIGVSNFKIATVLLVGLFFYDIFWVFGTEVMVKVAMNFEGPAKIIFPLTIDGSKKSILGLGDVVIPGSVVAMTLRFDKYLASKLHQLKSLAQPAIDTTHEEKQGNSDSTLNMHIDDVSKSYFSAQILFYVLGLLLTIIVMKTFGVAQPALLYLVPCALVALYGVSIIKGQFSLMWSYDEEKNKGATASGAVTQEKKNE